MRYRIAEPFKEVANRIARDGGMPAGKKRGYGQDQDNSALRSALFNISDAFPVGTPRRSLRQCRSRSNLRRNRMINETRLSTKRLTVRQTSNL
jgi:hypothetical protein